jgi:hypothetical protein
LYGGPRVAFNMQRSFSYLQKPNPDLPDQVAKPSVNGDFSKIDNTIISVQVGAGYDI